MIVKTLIFDVVCGDSTEVTGCFIVFRIDVVPSLSSDPRRVLDNHQHGRHVVDFPIQDQVVQHFTPLPSHRDWPTSPVQTHPQLLLQPSHAALQTHQLQRLAYPK